MKIRSRPDDDSEIAIGSGEFLIAFSDEQLELIAALLWCTRLGNRPYEVAASEILDILEIVKGVNFPQNAFAAVCPKIAEINSNSSTIRTIHDFHIEV